MKILGIIMTVLLASTLVACASGGGGGGGGGGTPSKPTVVTQQCTSINTIFLTANGEVKDIGGGLLSLLSRRGFVYMEGTVGDPELNNISLVNPSFESGDPPEGWAYRNSTQVSRDSNVAKVGSYALKYEYPSGDGYPYVRGNQTFSVIDWGGKTLTAGAWVKSTQPNTRMGFMEWGGTYWTRSSACSADGEWHYLTCTATIPTSLTANWTIAVYNTNTTASYTFWADDVVLVTNAVFEDGSFDIGNYSLVINQLTPATSYRVRAFGENSAGIGYGNTITCQTS